MDKGTLQKLLDSPKSGKLKEKGGLLRYKIAKHIAEAMAFIHNSGYMHCDLTTSNILVIHLVVL
jgi:tRNA A-37 threonylcarbamoyl transferase component Bud32